MKVLQNVCLIFGWHLPDTTGPYTYVRKQACMHIKFVFQTWNLVQLTYLNSKGDTYIIRTFISVGVFCVHQPGLLMPGHIL